ncbi:glycosyltransferase family 4 protein [Cytophagaceae bacterium ABcell3]|nr:glycosyltransferase family 4 protein [Cytophagaceae bacterium ABcell3]
MTIAIITNTSWNIWNFRMGLAQALQSAGYKVIAIAPKDDFTHKIIAKGIPHYPINMENRGSNPLKDLKLLWDFYRIYQKTSPDLLLQFTIKPNIYGTMAAKLLKIPVINNVSGLGTTFLHKGFVSNTARLLYKFAFRHTNKVFFQNNDDRQLFIRYKLIEETKTGLVPGSGINLHMFQYTPPTPNDSFTFLAAARLLYDKGIEEYAMAAQLLRNKGIKATFKLAGAIDKNPKLGIPEKKIEEWHSKGVIEYIGFKEQLNEEMSKADCIVLPSYREGTPRTLLEAAAIGRPIITTDVPGCRETVVEHKNGLLCKRKDVADLAEKMETMLNLSFDKVMEMGIESRALVERKFDERIVVERYLSEIENIDIGKPRIPEAGK